MIHYQEKRDYFTHNHALNTCISLVFYLLFSKLNLFLPVFEMVSSLSSTELGKGTTQY